MPRFQKALFCQVKGFNKLVKIVPRKNKVSFMTTNLVLLYLVHLLNEVTEDFAYVFQLFKEGLLKN